MASTGATNPGQRPTEPRAATPSLTAEFLTLSSIVGVLVVATVVTSLLVGSFHPSGAGTADVRAQSDLGTAFASFAGQPADASASGGSAVARPSTTVASNGSDERAVADDVVAGANAPSADADGDGYPDVMERSCLGLLPEADPQAHDVYVEVDATGNTSLDDEAVERLEDAFAEAPVTGPDGESGIRLHVVRSDTGLPEPGPVDIQRGNASHDDVWDYREEYFDNAGAGYYYLLLTSDAAYEGNTYYAGAGTNGTALVESYDSPDVMTSLIMHELGHAFGLDHDHAGVDSREYDRDAYESVMNYNALYEVQTYADGDDDVGRDEWAYITEDRYAPSVDPPENGTCGDP